MYKINKKNVFFVQNAEGDPDTTAEIIIQNKIDFEPKVSVIIPVYNVEEYLRECLDSIVNQTLKEIEIICIDDGSTDDSLEILKEYAQKDCRITVISKSNKGLSHTRNIGIKIAIGEYVGFVDSDDWVNKEFYEELYKNAIQFHADISTGNIYRVDKNKEKIILKFNNVKEATILEEKFSIYSIPLCCYVPNRIYLRDKIKKNNLYFKEGIYFEDMVWMPDVLKTMGKCVTTPKSTYYYRDNPKSICTIARKNSIQRRDLFNSQRYMDSFLQENKLSQKIYNSKTAISTYIPLSEVDFYYQTIDSIIKKNPYGDFYEFYIFTPKDFYCYKKFKKFEELSQCKINFYTCLNKKNIFTQNKKYDQYFFLKKEGNSYNMQKSNERNFAKDIYNLICKQKRENKNSIINYLLFSIYLIKTARMKKKIHKKICRIIRGQLNRQFENTLLLTKPQIRDFALKNSPAPNYVKKNIKKITNDIYDKFHFRKKHRILGIKFYTKNKHKELSSLLTYSIKQNELIKKENTILKNQIEETKKENSVLKSQIEETKKELQKTIQSNKNDILTQLSEFKNKNQRNYQELNYADLLHDTIHQSNWLKDKTFSLFGWAANYSFIYLLFRTLDQVCPTNILEFGLGQTTKLTSQYIVNKNPSAQLNICEHNQDWINIYKKELAKSENIKINHLDLEFFEYDNKQNDKYKNIIQVTKNQKFDLIIVDGPVGGGKNLPRSNIHDLIKNDNLANDFIIIFDDAERKGEQETIRITKDLLTEKNIQFSTFSRNGIKNQFIITSPSREFLKFL